MPPPLSGNKVTKVSSLKIPAIFAQEPQKTSTNSTQQQQSTTVVKSASNKKLSLIHNKFIASDLNATKVVVTNGVTPSKSATTVIENGVESNTFENKIQTTNIAAEITTKVVENSVQSKPLQNKTQITTNSAEIIKSSAKVLENGAQSKTFENKIQTTNSIAEITTKVVENSVQSKPLQNKTQITPNSAEIIKSSTKLLENGAQSRITQNKFQTTTNSAEITKSDTKMVENGVQLKISQNKIQTSTNSTEISKSATKVVENGMQSNISQSKIETTTDYAELLKSTTKVIENGFQSKSSQNKIETITNSNKSIKNVSNIVENGKIDNSVIKTAEKSDITVQNVKITENSEINKVSTKLSTFPEKLNANVETKTVMNGTPKIFENGTTKKLMNVNGKISTLQRNGSNSNIAEKVSGKCETKISNQKSFDTVIKRRNSLTKKSTEQKEIKSAIDLKSSNQNLSKTNEPIVSGDKNVTTKLDNANENKKTDCNGSNKEFLQDSNVKEKPKVKKLVKKVIKKVNNKCDSTQEKSKESIIKNETKIEDDTQILQKDSLIEATGKVRQPSVDSNYGSSSTIQTSPSLSSLSSNETITTSNYESPSTLTQSSVYDTAKSQLGTCTNNTQLPPIAPTSTRKQQPIKKAHTSPLHLLPESTQKLAAYLQTRPLQNANLKSGLIHRSLSSSDDNKERITTGRLVISRSPSPVSSRYSISRSASPSLSRISRSRSLSSCTRTCTDTDRSPTPRRIFPQEPTKISLEELKTKEQSPVVFDANLSFIIGCKSQMRQNLTSSPAHLDPTTASNYLSTKIAEFLNRTDHVMDEWKNLGHRSNDDDSYPISEEQRRILGRSKSAANIAIKGYTLFSKDRSQNSLSLTRSRSNSTVRDLMTDDVFSECDELSEMTADLAEEHSTATLAAERLDAETSERIRLERELSEVQNKNKSLQQQSERLEMELLYARSDINGVISEEDEDGESDHSIYKSKYERAVRELEFTRRRLQQQHEDDLEQLVGLKKQLEKKLSDAYEEVEEQRQVVGQWKRKVQKLTSEMNDLRLLIEEQNARNNLLEKKQRKFDSETQLLNDELRQERQQRERISREKDLILAEKYTLESNLADVRLELELKEERLNGLQQEYNDLTFGGKSEDEVATLRKQKQDAERRIHEQEEELDDLAGQVQMLEQAKVRLEMSLEQQRKEARREAQQRDDELEEIRCNAQKKVKALEAQLENEHEERTLLLREKHSLERRLAALTEAGRTEREGDEALLQRLKRDLRRTKALLRDAQTMLERSKADSPGKAVIRQLRNQLDDLECARAAAVKAKQSAESELVDVQSQLDEAHRQKADAEERANIANRERAELRTQLEENEEELAEVLKKYRSTVQQLSSEQLALQEQLSLVSELEAERNSLKEQLSELTTKLESMENLADPSSTAHAKRMELRAKELESKLEFEQTTRARLEVQIARLKETTDKLQTDLAQARTREQQAQDNLRKVQRTLRELREEHAALTARENESTQKRKELEKKLEASEAETAAARADLRLALQRIDDLQAAIQGELEDTPSDHSDSDNDSYSSDESIDTFLANHKISPTKLDRTALRLDTSPSFFLL